MFDTAGAPWLASTCTTLIPSQERVINIFHRTRHRASGKFLLPMYERVDTTAVEQRKDMMAHSLLSGPFGEQHVLVGFAKIVLPTGASVILISF